MAGEEVLSGRPKNFGLTVAELNRIQNLAFRKAFGLPFAAEIYGTVRSADEWLRTYVERSNEDFVFGSTDRATGARTLREYNQCLERCWEVVAKEIEDKILPKLEKWEAANQCPDCDHFMHREMCGVEGEERGICVCHYPDYIETARGIDAKKRWENDSYYARWKRLYDDGERRHDDAMDSLRMAYEAVKKLNEKTRLREKRKSEFFDNGNGIPNPRCACDGVLNCEDDQHSESGCTCGSPPSVRGGIFRNPSMAMVGDAPYGTRCPPVYPTTTGTGVEIMIDGREIMDAMKRHPERAYIKKKAATARTFSAEDYDALYDANHRNL